MFSLLATEGNGAYSHPADAQPAVPHNASALRLPSSFPALKLQSSCSQHASHHLPAQVLTRLHDVLAIDLHFGQTASFLFVFFVPVTCFRMFLFPSSVSSWASTNQKGGGGGGGSIPSFSNLRANCQCVPGQDTASQTVLVVLEMYEWCVKEKGGMHIEAMYECVCEWVNVTCSLKNWVVNKTTMGYNTVYLPFKGVAWTSTCDYSQMKGWLSSLMDGELGRGIIGAESQTPTFVFETQSSHLFPWKSEFRDPNSWELEAAAH